MRVVLHITTQARDPLMSSVVKAQEQEPGIEVRRVDLAVPEPDYAKLLEEIFAADAVAVW